MPGERLQMINRKPSRCQGARVLGVLRDIDTPKCELYRAKYLAFSWSTGANAENGILQAAFDRLFCFVYIRWTIVLDRTRTEIPDGFGSICPSCDV